MVFIQRCVNRKRSESRGGIPHVSLADLWISPKGTPRLLVLSPAFCFLSPVQAVLPASKWRGHIWPQVTRPIELVQFPDNHWFSLCI